VPLYSKQISHGSHRNCSHTAAVRNVAHTARTLFPIDLVGGVRMYVTELLACLVTLRPVGDLADLYFTELLACML
jgi:hypothetical protein